MIACLSYDGYIGLQHAAKLVPESYGTLRKSRVCDIANYFVKVNHPINCPKNFKNLMSKDYFTLLTLLTSLQMIST